MGLVVAMAVRLVTACLVLRLSEAVVYKVGDSAGWTTIGNVDYKLWASSKNFHIGDTILFEYNPQFHNVMRVTHPLYRSCNTSNPLSTFTTGNDSITLTNHGHHFFFCGVPGHCQAGQKVDIHVLHPSVSSPMSPPEPPSTSVSSPTVPASGLSGPSPNLAPSLPGAAAAATAALLVYVVSARFAF